MLDTSPAAADDVDRRISAFPSGLRPDGPSGSLPGLADAHDIALRPGACHPTRQGRNAVLPEFFNSLLEEHRR